MAEDPTPARLRMVADLVERGALASPALVAAFQSVPRHLFLPALPPAGAYVDDAIITKTDPAGLPVSSSSQPTIMAAMLEQLALEAGQRVLEIGAGTGYNAALIAHAVGPSGTVVSVDIDPDTVESARHHLVAAGAGRVDVQVGDGAEGWPPGAPYDRMILTVGSEDVPAEWVAQLAPEGRLVLPLGFGGMQASVAFVARDDHLESESVVGCGFMRLRGRLHRPGRSWALDAAGQVVLETSDDGPIDPSNVLGLPRVAPLTSGVAATAAEAVDGLGLWVAIHDRRAVRLLAYGPASGDRRLPALLRCAGSSTTCGLVDDRGAAFFDRRPEDRGLLCCRPLGPSGPDLAEALVAAAGDWDAAGRPRLEQAHITAWTNRPAPAPIAGAVEILLGEAAIHLSWDQRQTDG